MHYGIFDVMKLGIGPSSSHTVGPMRASRLFLQMLKQSDHFKSTFSLQVHLYGSLALTGKGHGIERAMCMGLCGETPEAVDPLDFESTYDLLQKNAKLNLLGERSIDFELKKDLIFHQKIFLPFHPNGMTFEAYDQKNKLLQRETFFSVGGGFVQREGEEQFVSQHPKALFPFTSGKELLHFCQIEKCSISQLMWKNEMHWAKNNSTQIEQGIDNIMAVMLDCIERGQKHQGVLPGALKVKRRAWDTHQQLLTARKSRGEYAVPDPLEILDWVNLFALAVNEENAAGGKVVTAPTNGAAGIVPAVLQYYLRFCPGATREKARAYLLTASAIGILYKLNASISGAEVGCQGEVGVACSMAAAGLCEVSGGNIWQVENAAEIAMEHNLGLTCDPVGGLVQIPCIERNAMGAVKAINASRLALKGDGQHHISLDQVIKTMRQTGLDMQSKYKETSQGGLAVNFTEC